MGGLGAVILSSGPAAAIAQPAVVLTPSQAGGNFSVPVVSYRDLPFRVVVHQQRDFSCGSAALATLLTYQIGKSFGEEKIFAQMYAVGDQATIRRVGFSLLDMKHYLHSIGYEADGYRVPLDALLAKKAPSIVVIRSGHYKHFVVVKGFRDGQVLIGDPAFGLRAEPASVFAKTWEGIVFLIHQDVPDAARAFNRDEDWRLVARSPTRLALGLQSSASAITRDLPPLYQLTPTFNANPR